jgi:hypothetical protein
VIGTDVDVQVKILKADSARGSGASTKVLVQMLRTRKHASKSAHVIKNARRPNVS